jgi:hypothetical protein
MEVASLKVSASQCNDPNEMLQFDKPRAMSVSLNGRDRDLRECRWAEHRRLGATASSGLKERRGSRQAGQVLVIQYIVKVGGLQ